MDPTINKRAAEALIPIINGALDLQRCGLLRPGTLAALELPSETFVEMIEALKTPMVEADHV